MAGVFMKKATGEQLQNHTFQQGSTCTRCGGLMVTDFCMDLLFCTGETEFAAQRCVQCGEVVDPVILQNRGIRQEPMMVQPA